MSSPLPALERPPEARAETVEDLIHLAQRGRIRVPPFQRGLKWESQQVLDLFDSVHRGLPIGALLLFKRNAPASRIRLGPVHIDAPETSQALWLVDGQQRVTSLVACLVRPLPIPRTPDDPFVVYFDPAHGSFHAPAASGSVPSAWVPLPILLDAAALGEWVIAWPHRKDPELRRRVFEAGKRIREYRLPLYVVDTDDPQILKEIFFRVNNTGKRLEWHEVHDALYGHEGASPSTMTELANELMTVGMGRLSESELTSCLLAFRGLDVTRTLADHRRRDPDVLRGAAAEALPALRQVLSFLRAHAGIPHLRLLPRSLVVEVLARFFALHPEPKARTQELLTRWVWRALLGEQAYDERTLRRRGVAAVREDEEASAQALLALLPRDRQRVHVPDTFDARAAGSRLALVALASLHPRDLIEGVPIDLADLIERDGVDAFPTLVSGRSVATPLSRSPANRLLHPAVGKRQRLLVDRIRDVGPEDPVLASHAISVDAAAALLAGRVEDLLNARRRTILQTLDELGDRLAGWSRRDRDRPSLAYLLRQAGDAA